MSHAHFFASVDTRKRSAMVDFLCGHYRYNTMNSWNGSTSYANCVKLNRLGLTREQLDRAYELLDVEDGMDFISHRIHMFTESQQGHYTMGTNGRSGGYLVLYDSHYKQSEYKSRCRSCGQLNFKLPADLTGLSEAERQVATYAINKGGVWNAATYLNQSEVKAMPGTDEEKLALLAKWNPRAKDSTVGNRCGRCHAEGERGRVPYSARELVTSCKSIDADAIADRFADWSMNALRLRVKLVQDFDRCCDDIRSDLIDTIAESEVIEETVMVPKKVKVLVPREGAV